ncbi:glycoside hydrolase family 16 protein [Pseudarthrobacter sp. RMG13]|uniref:Glycoside hydrolase family 16 protein n=1 Tax=Pseudarthrobacter humi TaxID=2952523 RepID=A0ABT1LNU9_9MICC|nr:glycoside hydrolase family 16 protein [Pseudarthrobacter humi]MCP9000107.1 glycoside hydrolase family 16 protein [Pseudarthrobacter humi]
MGALSLTGCGLAPTTNGASAPSSAGRTSAPATPAPTAAATASSAAASPAPTASGSDQTPDSAAAAVAPPAPALAAAPAPAQPGPAAGQALATTGDGAQAATAFGWGPVLTGDEFSNTGAPDRTKWSVYNSAGHAGKGVRSPQAWSVANGVATVSGDAAGTTGGMSAKFAEQKYGRWETRMKTNARDPKYHPVLILNNNAAPNCAEIDYAEGSSVTSVMRFFLHYACGGADFQTTAATPVDGTQWHNYAVEWTPAGISGYVDGVKTFTDTNPAHQPSTVMKQTLQLDWFPDGSATKPSQMQVDWVRVYK